MDGENLQVSTLLSLTFRRFQDSTEIAVSEPSRRRIAQSHRSLLGLLESKTPIYGVTTGFGDSGNRTMRMQLRFLF